ncbi:MAG: GDP-mannose 4,6-dehydratase [Gammaproteobacteria bacterium]|nr:GDP-mannose 4,6-dehydratase [Gammaproteobacteria bacterium]
MNKKALITGVSGQDGAYLSRLLIEKGYDVYGAYRRSASPSTWRMRELGVLDQVKLVPMEMMEYSNILSTVREIEPDEVYNLAAQSFVATSFEQPLYTSEVDALGVLRCLEVIRDVDPQIRFYQASTSELFGMAERFPQDERTPFHPRSPYGVSKLFAHWITVNYRESYGLHAVSGILFNHESPLRGAEFVTRKITLTLALIRHGCAESLELGNLESRRDWGFAADYVHGIWLMMQSEKPEDYVLATGESHSVREFVNHAAACAGFELEWEGEGKTASAVDRASGRTIVKVNPKYYRPAEVEHLVGDASKARSRLGWSPETGFSRLVEMMVEADLERVRNGTVVY